MTYPTIRVSGDGWTRGTQYGRMARDRVHRTIAMYATVFAARADWSWDDARERAVRFRDEIDASTGYLEEISGIAHGADVDVLDIIAINARTELLAMAPEAGGTRRSDGCTAFGFIDDMAAREPKVVLGQTWDWLAPTIDSVVVLEVQRDDGPDYVTVVEAGILAKAGMNSAGLGVCTNFLVTTNDGSGSGLPYHVTLRALFDQETLPDALGSLLRMNRASSANYLLGHEDGMCVDIEAEPGGGEGLHLHHPVTGAIAHANHFLAPAEGDITVAVTPDSPFRQTRMDMLLGDRRDREAVQAALSDHVNYPRSICAHADLRLPEHEREATSFGLTMDLAARRMFLADGNPCANPWRELDVSGTLVDTRPPREEIAPALRA